jgi:hypothetical protein
VAMTTPTPRECADILVEAHGKAAGQ